MLHHFKSLLALTPAERSVLAYAFLSLFVIDLGLRSRGFRRVVTRAQEPGAGTAGASVTSEQFVRAQWYARWIAVAARHHFVAARCLHRSLTLHHWLRQEGLPSELRIGVRPERGELTAHAWVELGGKPADELPEHVAAFKPLVDAQGRFPDWSPRGYTA